jgi:hypothetical protein
MWRVWVTAVIVAVLVSPTLRDRDSFPLSTYPMYANVRSEAEDFIVVTALDQAGNQRALSMQIVAQTDDPLIARGVLDNAVRADALADLCQQIAARSAPWTRTVIITRERHRLVDVANGDPSLVQGATLERCDVSP